MNYNALNDAISTTIITYGILGILIPTICGFVTKKMNKDKGYDDGFGGFAWGFFLGVIGVAIVALRTPQINNSNKENYITNKDDENEIKKYKKMFDDGLITEEEFNAKRKQILNI